MAKVVLDLCCGTKSATAEFARNGWKVITIDIDPRFEPTACKDVRNKAAVFSALGNTLPDFVWASPPCTEFAREFMPWCKTGEPPDISIVLACRDLIRVIKPYYWCIENVRGAVYYFRALGLGGPRAIVGPFYLWGNFPDIGKPSMAGWRKKETMSSSRDVQRGAIPKSLAKAVYTAVASQMKLFEEASHGKE